VRELVDLQLLGFDLFVAAGELGKERRGQISQLCCVHFIELARQLHGLDAAIFAAISTYFFAIFSSQNADLRALIETLPRQSDNDRLKLLVAQLHAAIMSHTRADEAAFVKLSRT